MTGDLDHLLVKEEIEICGDWTGAGPYKARIAGISNGWLIPVFSLEEAKKVIADQNIKNKMDPEGFPCYGEWLTDTILILEDRTWGDEVDTTFVMGPGYVIGDGWCWEPASEEASEICEAAWLEHLNHQR